MAGHTWAGVQQGRIHPSGSILSVQEAYAEMASLEAELRCRADSSQAELQKLVDSKDKREQELYIKVLVVDTLQSPEPGLGPVRPA